MREDESADASKDGWRERRRVLPDERSGEVREAIIPCATVRLIVRMFTVICSTAQVEGGNVKARLELNVEKGKGCSVNESWRL